MGLAQGGGRSHPGASPSPTPDGLQPWLQSGPLPHRTNCPPASVVRVATPHFIQAPRVSKEEGTVRQTGPHSVAPPTFQGSGGGGAAACCKLTPGKRGPQWSLPWALSKPGHGQWRQGCGGQGQGPSLYPHFLQPYCGPRDHWQRAEVSCMVAASPTILVSVLPARGVFMVTARVFLRVLAASL